MSENDDMGFLEFKTKIEDLLVSLPTDDDRERFLSILAQLAGKIDSQAVTKRGIKRDVMGHITKALDRLAKEEAAKQGKGLWATLLAKALNQAEEELPPADDQWAAMRLVVAQALVKGRVRKAATVPSEQSTFVKSTAASGGASPASNAAMQAIRDWGGGDVPASLAKSRPMPEGGDGKDRGQASGEARRDWAKALVEQLKAYKEWLVAGAGGTEGERAAIIRQVDTVIAGYQKWASGEDYK